MAAEVGRFFDFVEPIQASTLARVNELVDAPVTRDARALKFSDRSDDLLDIRETSPGSVAQA